MLWKTDYENSLDKGNYELVLRIKLANLNLPITQ